MTKAKSQAQVARDLGLIDGQLYGRVSQYRGEVLSEDNDLNPAQELAALKKENAQLKQEREILKKAVNIFSRKNV